MSKATNWTTVTESKYSWEQDALDFVREQFPSHDPCRAWSNFEFIADDGSINEVDLLVFTPQGFFLIEIKSRPGRLFGDAGTWTWETDGRLSTVDNPLLAANLKAKKLRSLLERQKAVQKKGKLPFIEALVFCSAPDLQCELQGNARFHVCVRDRAAAGDSPERPGIMAAIKRRECVGLDSYAKGTFDRPMMKVVSQAMDQAGIRPSQRTLKVSDYILQHIIDEGPNYQDWQAGHCQVAESKRRVRLYFVRTEATLEDRQRIERAALREFQILETLGHPGILKASIFTEHEVGPALLFEQGACSIALLVQRDDQDFILKVAADPDDNVRLRDEIELLNKLRHAHVVELAGALELGDRTAFLMHPVYVDRQKKLVETLGQRLRKEGRLHVDLLQRFGEDLLDVVNFLEEQGIPHRDIKPDNIAVGSVGRGDKLHLVLFDFSLSRTPTENIRAGTTGYLDPLLPLRNPPRWDLHAERYAAAVTLYELATGALPKWGDGATNPSHLSPETEITIDSEAFDVNLREPLSAFFKTAFKRNIKGRFDNGEVMLREWRKCFEGIDDAGTLSDHADESQLRELLVDATFVTHIGELGFGTRAMNALDMRNILTVEDLLSVPLRRIARFRGVGNKTRREITAVVKILRERLGTPEREQPLVPEEEASQAESIDIGTVSIDLLADRILKTGVREGETFQRVAQLLLGLMGSSQQPAVSGPDSKTDNRQLTTDNSLWLSQSEMARTLDVSRARVGQIIGKIQDRWGKEPALTRLRTDLAEMVASQAGVMSAAELGEALLLARGSSQDEPKRSQLAAVVLRAAVEVERATANPRFMLRREDDLVLIALSGDLASFARRLGDAADLISQEDPLVAPVRCLERLREVPSPNDVPIPDARLIRLAAVVSGQAAVSSRQELYPRGMPAVRALKLSQGALLGLRSLTIEQIRERVGSRYPEAAPLPDRTALDDLLREAGFDFRWNPEGKDGVGCYLSQLRDSITVTTGTESLSRWHTSYGGGGEVGEITQEEADARQFEERLTRAIKDGSFLTLLVNPKHYDRARDELCRRFPLKLVDFEGLFLESLHNIAEAAKVKWDLVLKTDAQPNSGDWDKLMMLVVRSMPAVEKQLDATDKTMLLIYPGLLARYDQMELLSRLSQKVGRRDGIPGLWLLLPGDNQALLDGKPVPLIGPGQKARIPLSWLKNLHRGNGEKLSSDR